MDGFGGGGGTGGLSRNADAGPELGFGIASLRSVSAWDARASRSTLRSDMNLLAFRFRLAVSSVSSV